jgi:hypothetical protein
MFKNLAILIKSTAKMVLYIKWNESWTLHHNSTVDTQCTISTNYCLNGFTLSKHFIFTMQSTWEMTIFIMYIGLCISEVMHKYLLNLPDSIFVTMLKPDLEQAIFCEVENITIHICNNTVLQWLTDIKMCCSNC